MSGSGFPNAAEEAGTEPLNLHRLIVKRPASTFFMRLDSDSHAEMGLYAGDVLVVDRSLRMRSGDVVVVHLEGEFVMKRYFSDDGNPRLLGGPREQPLLMTNEIDALVWGVVSHAVHDFRKDIMF